MTSKNKIIFFALSLIILLTLSAGAISAADADSNATSVDAADSSASSTVSSDAGLSDNDVNEVTVSKDTKKVSASNDNQKAEQTTKKTSSKTVKEAEDDGTFTDLNTQIQDSDSVTLDKNYVKGSSEGNITIDKTVSIDGNGYTIDANQQASAFIIGSNGNVEIKNTIFTNLQGATEGYVRNQSFFIVDGGVLTLNNVTFTNNNGTYGTAGIYMDSGTTKIYDSTFNNSYGAYGAIYAYRGCDLTISGSTFNNISTQKGAICLSARTDKANITGSTFTNNYASLYGAAIQNDGNLSVDACTFESNTAGTKGGAIYVGSQNATIKNSVFKYNKVELENENGQGGAIATRGDIYLENNTITDNSAYNGSDIFVEYINSVSPVVLTFGNTTAVEDETFQLTANVTDDNGNKITGRYVTFSVAGNTYTAYADEGVATVEVSDAINPEKYTITGSYDGVISDEGLTVNAGNLEIVKSNVFTYSKLQALIDEDSTGTITLEKDVKRSSAENRVVVNKTVVIDGNGLTINANNGKIFDIEDGAALTLKNILIYNANGTVGSIANVTGSSTLNLDNVTIVNSTSENFGTTLKGSLIYVEQGSNANINHADIENSTRAVLYIEGTTSQQANVVVNDTIIKNINAYTSDDNDQAVIILRGSLTLGNSTISDNKARLSTVYASAQYGSLNIDNTTFANNVVPVGNGGAIDQGGVATITNSKFINNSVTRSFGRNGGAIYSGNDLTIANTLFMDNTATSDGSIIYNAYGNLNVTYSVLIPSGDETAIYNDANAVPTLNYNWWGTNDNPSQYFGVGSEYDDFTEETIDYPMPQATYWVVMNTTLIPSANPDYNSQLTVKSTFKTYTDANGNNQTLENNLPDGFAVTYSSTKGTFASEETIVFDGETENAFTVPVGESTITVTQASQTYTFTITPVMPEPATLVITEENFYEYFNADGTLKLDKVMPYSQLEFSGELHDKNMTITIPVNLTTHTTQAAFTDATITLSPEAEGTNITNLIITNDDEYSEYVILANGTSNINIKNNTIQATETSGILHTIEVVDSEGIVIENNTITTYGPADSIVYVGYVGFANVSSIKVYNSDKNSILNNKITTIATSNNGALSTIDGVEILGHPFTGDESNGNIVSGNVIVTEGGEYTYSVLVSCGDDNKVANNNITATGTYYANGVSLTGPAAGNVISYNNVNATATTLTYGLYVSTNYMGAVTNNNISYNNITTKSSSNYGIELWGANYNNIASNNITNDLDSPDYAMGIGLSRASNNNITGNYIDIAGYEQDTPVYYEELEAENVGIKLVVNSNNNTITDNDITSVSAVNEGNYAVNLTNTTSNTVVENNLQATYLMGDSAVATNGTNTIKGNSPSPIITDDTYKYYFNDDGTIKAISNGSSIYLQGEFFNKNFTIDRTLNINTADGQAILKNSTFNFTAGSESSVLENIIINNTNYAESAISATGVDNITISNVTITQENDEGSTHGIVFNNSNYNTVKDSNINVTGLSYNIEYYESYGMKTSYGFANTSAIKGANANNNNITNNNIVVKAKGLGTEGSKIDTIIGIDFSGNSYDWDNYGENTAEDNSITGNNVTLDAIGYGYAIKVADNADNTNISGNTINSTAQGSAYGIELEGPSSYAAIANNQVTATSGEFAYGINLLSIAGQNNLVTIDNNTVVVNTNVGYGLELQNVDTPAVTNNAFTVTGNYSMGIGGVKVTNGEILNNTISTTGNSDNDLLLSVDEVSPENTGIKLVNASTSLSTGNNIQNNTITVNDLGSANDAYTVILNGTKDNTVANNTLRTNKNLQGSQSVSQIDSTGNVVQENMPETPAATTISVSDIALEPDEEGTITAVFRDENGNLVKYGNALFYVEGVLYGTVALVDGTASITYENGVVGTYTLKVAYDGTPDYAASEATANIIIYGPSSYTGTVYVATWGSDANDGTRDSPKATVKKAVAQALRDGGSHDVVVLEGTYNVNGLTINDYINITGEGDVVFDGQGLNYILNTTAGDIIIKNIKFINGNNTAYDYGGAIYNEANLTLVNATFENNTARYGGAIATKSNLTIINSTFDNNVATTHGGAINTLYNRSLVLEITGSTFKNNRAQGGSGNDNGGAIYQSSSGNLTITDSVFDNNTASIGGALYTNAEVVLNNVTLTNNVATTTTSENYGGGAIYASGSKGLTINNSVITDNYAAYNGGAIFASGSPTYIINSTISNNSARGNGAGIYAKVNLTVANSTLDNNHVIGRYDGGAIYYIGSKDSAYSGTLVIGNSTFDNNTAQEGAIAFISQAHTVTIDNSTFTNNGGNKNSSLIRLPYYSTTTGVINNSKFIENTGNATVYGYHTKLAIENTLFENNDANGTVLSGTGITTSNNKYIGNNLNTEMTITVPESTPGTGNIIPIEVTVSLDDVYSDAEFDGTIIVYEDGVQVGSYDVSNNSNVISFVYNYTTMDVGSHNLAFEYSNSQNSFASAGNAATLDVVSGACIDIAPIEDTKINKTFTIQTTVTDPDGNPINGGTVAVYVDGIKIDDMAVADGTASMDASIADAGLHIIRTDYYNANGVCINSNTTTVNVAKLKTTATIDAVVAKINQTTTLTAHIYDENGNPVNGGKVVFKINGVTIKDANGNPIYAYVADGIAQITTSFNFKAKSYTIYVVYSGNDEYESVRVSNGSLVITQREGQVTVSNPQSVVSGNTVTVNVTVKDENGSLVNGGKVVCKINGVSMRDSYGNVMYATVKNGVAQITYKLPAKMSTKVYNITAVYSSPSYIRLEGNSTMAITKASEA